MIAYNINQELHGGWRVRADVDEDGHLTVAVSHINGEVPIDTGMDCGRLDEYATRFTVPSLEE